jgi:hypothetical protein
MSTDDHDHGSELSETQLRVRALETAFEPRVPFSDRVRAAREFIANVSTKPGEDPPCERASPARTGR